MRVYLTIWISAVLIQEVIPGTLVRLPRHTPKRPALVQTEYEGKYEQKGQNGKENSGLFSGKQEIVHCNCAENWNDFADKCAALVKDLVASLANSVSSRPGDATNLQLQIKNTFKHFDSTHNCTCLNDTVNNTPKLDLSCLFNNITITTVAPTVNNNKNDTETNNKPVRKNCKKQSNSGKNGSDLREGVVGPGSNGDGGDGNESSGGLDNNTRTQYSHPAGVSGKPNTVLDRARNPGFSPENNSEAGSNSRRQAEYPQVSWQPANKTRPSPINHGRSNNIGRSRYPFIVTPQPNTAYATPSPATYSSGNNLPNGRNGIGPGGQTNSNASPAGASRESGTPLTTQPLPASSTYQSGPASDSQYKTGVPATSSLNSAYPPVTGVPSALDDRHPAAPLPTGPGGYSSKNRYTLPRAPVTEDSYEPKPVPVKPMTDGLRDSQPEITPSTEPRGPKFPPKNSPVSRDSSNKPELFLSTSTDPTSEYPQSNVSPSLSKNQYNRPVAEIIQPVSSVTSEDSRSDSISRTPNTKPVLTTGKPEGFTAQKDKKVGVPVINSDSNIPEWWGPESQRGTTNPLPTGRNLNPSSTASINQESEPTNFAPTTDKFSDTITPPSDLIPPSVHVEPALPEPGNHKSEGPLDANLLNNPSDQSVEPVIRKPSSLPQNFDHLGGSSLENVDGKPKRGAPVTIHSTSSPTTIPLGSNANENFGTSTTEEDDCEEDNAEDVGKTATATILEPSGQSLQGTGTPESNTEEGNSGIQTGIGQSPVSEPNSNTHSDSEDDEDCDEFTESDSTNSGIDNQGTTVEVPPIHPVPKKSDPGSVPVSDGGSENTGSSLSPNNVPHDSSSIGSSDYQNSVSHSSSNTGTASDETVPVTVSSAQSVSHTEVQKVQGNVPAPDDYEDCDEYTDATTPIAGSPAQPVPKVSDPVMPASDHVAENIGPSDDRNTVPISSSNMGTANSAIAPVAEFPVTPDTGKSDSVRGSVPANDVGGESTGYSTVPQALLPHDSTNTGFTTTPNIVTQGSSSPVPTEPITISNNVPQGSSYTGITNDAANLVTASPIQPISTVPDPVGQQNVPTPEDYEDCTENTESSNDATAPVEVSPVKPVPVIPDPAVQGNVPAPVVDSENPGTSNNPSSESQFSSSTGTSNYPSSESQFSSSTGTSNYPSSESQFSSSTGTSDYPNSVPVTSSNTGIPNHETTPVAVPPINSLPNIPDPAVQGNIPASAVVGENPESSIYPNSPSHLSSSTEASDYPNSGSVTDSNIRTTNHETTPISVSPVNPVPNIPDPEVQGNVPPLMENTESSNYPNTLSQFSSGTGASDYPTSVPVTSSNTVIANDATTLASESPIKPPSTVSEPEIQPLESDDSPISKTISGVDGDENVNSQTPLNITPSPHSPDDYTTVSTISEVQSRNPGNEDIYKPTTFQTTASDPTSPQSILIPTESTGGLTKVPTPSHSSVDDDDDDDDEEDCCSCESCTEDITDPKVYKENACKNLEEARKELKAIFDKIKKNLKCGRKTCGHAIGHVCSGKRTSVAA